MNQFKSGEQRPTDLDILAVNSENGTPFVLIDGWPGIGPKPKHVTSKLPPRIISTAEAVAIAEANARMDAPHIN